MDKRDWELILQLIDQTISPQDFERLQDRLEHDETLREAYLRAISLDETLAEIAAEHSEQVVPVKPPIALGSRAGRLARWQQNLIQLCLAVVVLFVVGTMAFLLGQHLDTADAVADKPSLPAELRIAGHATLKRTVRAEWAQQQPPLRDGDLLRNGPFLLQSGVAEIDFFCGATIIVEGPADLEIESDWEVRVREGRLRASVPPAARGFVVKTDESDIIDLGTEFALAVDADRVHVEVIDGEVELRGGDHDGTHLLTGQGQSLRGAEVVSEDLLRMSTAKELRQRRIDAERQRYQHWQQGLVDLERDPRLVSFYPIAKSQLEAEIENASGQGNALNGLLVGPVEWTHGRFGAPSRGLAFDRAGARVRVRIDGEFSAFTFTCWARIDGLDHRYNALFMGDGYETGEPHWQIRDDGKLMFSVMVDDTQEIRHFSEIEQRVVSAAGLHRVYYSDPFWDPAKSGQWFHLAVVYSPQRRRVAHYVNGRPLGEDRIADKFFINKLRIGPGEIGNWGQPFRKTPAFAVRNLNGVVDELVIFSAALTPQEIRGLYEVGKPLGY